MKNSRILPRALVVLALVAPAAAFGRAEAAKTASTEKHCLWRVQGPEATVYLLGSVHCLQKTNYPLAGVMETAFDKAKVVAFEADVSEMEKPETQTKLLGKVMLPPGATLSSKLSKETYAAFSNHLETAGLPAALFEQFKPGMAAITLTILELQKMGFDAELGLDRHFHNLARKGDKEVMALETVDFQIDLISGFTDEEGEKLVTSTLKDLADLKTFFRDIIRAWETGNNDELAKLLNKAMKESPALYKRMITDRNEAWVPKIEQLIRGKKNALVVVGAGHLVGEKSVVDLLRKKGHKVIQE